MKVKQVCMSYSGFTVGILAIFDIWENPGAGVGFWTFSTYWFCHPRIGVPCCPHTNTCHPRQSRSQVDPTWMTGWDLLRVCTHPESPCTQEVNTI